MGMQRLARRSALTDHMTLDRPVELRVAPEPLTEVVAVRYGRFDRAAKRTLDITVSAIVLLVFSPVILACAIAIKLESPGPVFYRALRVGRDGSDLALLKFRKMTDGANGSALTGSHDPRFTRIGRFLARSKLDELPQLWNVLIGGMSLVGPRPEDRRYVDLHREAFETVLSVRPGVTGLCQLAFAKESEILNPEDREGHYLGRILPQKVALDVLYVETRTLSLDLRILAWTIFPVILRRDVAVNRVTADLTLRRRPVEGVLANPAE